MKTIVAFPSTAIFGQQAALAFEEHGALDAFLTTYAFKQGSAIGNLLKILPGSSVARLRKELERRAVPVVSEQHVETRAVWEVIRTVADKAGLDRRVVDRIWDQLSKDFTRAAARRLGPDTDILYAYEYTALEAFGAADRCGVAKVLDFPSLNSRQFQELQRTQKKIFPDLVEPEDVYFEALFEKRQARRDAEMHAADVIITNSSVTRASHIAGGADPERTFSVPYGAPPPIEALPEHTRGQGRLRVIWAGTFSIRKGAHLLIEAWNALGGGNDIQLEVYGAVTLPDRMWKPAPRGMTFHGSVVRPTLFGAYDSADVMIFPTLSDGFGMVVTEAFARGLPVITTDQAGASDLVRHGENGLVIPAGDSASIAESLRWCLDNRPHLASMAQAALDTARAWQWSDYRAELYEIVTSALAHQGKQQG